MTQPKLKWRSERPEPCPCLQCARRGPEPARWKATLSIAPDGSELDYNPHTRDLQLWCDDTTFFQVDCDCDGDLADQLAWCERYALAWVRSTFRKLLAGEP